MRRRLGFAQGLPFAGGEGWPRKDLALYCEIEGLCTLANKAHASVSEILCHFMLAAFLRGRLSEETRLGKTRVLSTAAGVARPSLAQEACGPFDPMKDGRL